MLPSATEIVCALGLEAQLVGVTHECDYPAAARTIRKVTRTRIPTDAPSDRIDQLVREQLDGGQSLYELDEEALRDARPDLIISQTLCRVCAVSNRQLQDAVEALPGSPRIVYLEPTRVEHVLENIVEVAEAAGVAQRGVEFVQALRARISRVHELVPQAVRTWHDHPPRVLVLEWLLPPFSCGHWTPELVERAGGVEVLSSAGQRSREVSIDQIVAADPDVLFVACCGYSLETTRRDLGVFLRNPRISTLRAVRESRVFAVDGSAYFSRPGPRLVDSLEILAHALAPDVQKLPQGLSPAWSPDRLRGI